MIAILALALLVPVQGDEPKQIAEFTARRKEFQAVVAKLCSRVSRAVAI